MAAYPWDVGSLSRVCRPRGVSETCIPGCTSNRGYSTWCDLNNDMWPCAYRPSALDKVMALRDETAKSNKQPEHKRWNDGESVAETCIATKPIYAAHQPEVLL